VVRTPPESAGCLAGVTRAYVLELCARDGIPCEEIDLPMRALAEADEAFLTSSTREVQAIATVDGAALPVAPGPITQQLREAFRARVAEEVAAFSR
jgi:branched-chain amino acid aminotransferase